MVRMYLAVAVGSALGGVARVGLSGLIYRRWGGGFPWGTMTVNLLGCFVLGALWSWTEGRFRLSPEARSFLIAGFCGGFTTFSTFALETIQMFKAGHATAAPLYYVVVSVVAGLGLFWLGAQLSS